MRRDLAIADALREQRPDVEVQWLTQAPVLQFLEQRGETVHPASAHLVSESAHFEAESGEHDLHAFEAIRRMDEVLVNNFMVFDDLVARESFDLWVGDEAWDLDHFLHENPGLKRAPFVWMTDFVGWVPMADGGEREAFLAADLNAEMVEHVARFPTLRDRSVFVGDPADVVDLPLGPDLPSVREWTLEHFDFSGYVTGHAPRRRTGRHCAAGSGTPTTDVVCVVSVGGSGVGRHLLRAGGRGVRRGPAAGPRPADGARDRTADRPGRVVVAPGRGGPRLPARPRPHPRGVRRRGRPGRAEHHHGAHRERAAVPLLPARPPLRAAGARAAPARPARRGPLHGLPRRRPVRIADALVEELGPAAELPRRCRPTAPRAPLSWWPS